MSSSLKLPSSVARSTRAIVREDLIPYLDYKKQRKDWMRLGIELTKKRRLFVGPHGSMTFGCYDSMWIQVQEMLLAEEKETDEEINEELEAFNPLIPASGNELIFTLMFEIDSKSARDRILRTLCDVEEHVYLKCGSHSVRSVPIAGEENVSRIDNHGKTSAVHFRKFVLDDPSILKAPASVSIEHPNYEHAATINAAMLEELKKDLRHD